MEDELAPSLRQIKHMGNDDQLRERFDSVFRRNLIELDAPSKALKKRDQKRMIKFKNRQGAAYGGTAGKKLMDENKLL